MTISYLWDVNPILGGKQNEEMLFMALGLKCRSFSWLIVGSHEIRLKRHGQ